MSSTVVGGEEVGARALDNASLASDGHAGRLRRGNLEAKSGQKISDNLQEVHVDKRQIPENRVAGHGILVLDNIGDVGNSRDLDRDTATVRVDSPAMAQ